jgi:uncharacterized membrane-anchored protein YhcB (DUF1043 family)
VREEDAKRKKLKDEKLAALQTRMDQLENELIAQTSPGENAIEDLISANQSLERDIAKSTERLKKLEEEREVSPEGIEW